MKPSWMVRDSRLRAHALSPQFAGILYLIRYIVMRASQKLNAAEKSAQQSISNALSALFKSKAVKRENGRYRAA